MVLGSSPRSLAILLVGLCATVGPRAWAQPALGQPDEAAIRQEQAGDATTPITAVPKPEPPKAALPSSSLLGSVSLSGRFVEPREQLLSFLGLAPGAHFGENDQERIERVLREALGYRIAELRLLPGPNGLQLNLRIEPLRVVRNVVIRGNFPLFDDEILRHLTVRTGARLPPDDELRAFLDAEQGRV